MKFLPKLIKFTATIFITLVAALYFLQERLIFPAPNMSAPAHISTNFTFLTIPTSDGKELAAYHHSAERGEATVLVFHGNGDAAFFQLEKGEALVGAGFGVLLVEYRGYPGSSGQPSEDGLYTDALSVYEYISKRGNEAIMIYAHSLGTGVAIDLAAKKPVIAMVLEAPYDSLKNVAQQRFPWAPIKWLMKHQFLSDSKISAINIPVLMIHGLQDRIIPIHHGKALHALANKQSEFLVLKNAGHNDLAKFGSVEKAVAFFERYKPTQKSN
ncbi:MAG: alpha/beta hydrolase [Rhizobiaceae bacterium]